MHQYRVEPSVSVVACDQELYNEKPFYNGIDQSGMLQYSM